MTVQPSQGPAGLVAAYGFDEGSGTTATDRTTNHNGSIAGATWTAGRYGSALSFDGTSSMVTISDSPSLDMANGLTLEAWIRPASSTGGWRDVIYRGDDNYFLATNTTDVYGALTVSSLGMVSADFVLPLNTWTHVAMSYDGSNIKIYANGVLTGIAPQTGNIAPSTSPLWLGGDPLHGQHFHGLIDEVRVYNRALTEAEIATDMNAPVATGDTTAPTISAVSAVNVTGNSATINWTTNEPSTSQVEYGPTTSYGSVTPVDNAMVTAHSVTLTGLAASTTYNYRVRSTDAASNQGVDTNKSFTTTGASPDTTPPSVPTNLTGIVVLPAQVNLSWTASTDNVGVTGYSVTRNAVPVGSPTATAYQDAGLAPGVYNYLVSARDAAGNTSAAAAVSVSVAPPRLDIIRPASAETIVGGVIDVTYAALGDVTDVNHVHFTLDTYPMVMDMTFDGSYRFINVPEGNHVLQGYLVYADHTAVPGTNDSVAFTTTVDDSTLPLVSMTAPLPGASVSGSILLSADASDNSAVAGVQFLVDGNPVGMEDFTAPYSSSWDSRAVGNGPHTITARARDIGGNVRTSNPVSVTVANSTSQEAEFGSWSTPAVWPLVPIHATLLHTGEVMVWDDHTEDQGYYLWNPTTSNFTFFAQTTQNLFCSAHTALADGRTLIMGGTVAGGGVLGIKDVSVFDPVTRNRTVAPRMNYARYYPSAITLGDGKVLTVAGNGDASCGACSIAIPEVFDPVSNTWTSLTTANLIMPYYPHLFLLPNGRVMVTGTSEENIATYLLNMSTKLWTTFDPTVIPSGSSAMYLPGKIMKTGFAGSPNGDIPGTRTTYVIDMNAGVPAWRQVPSMAFARAQHMLTSLPDGTVLVTGGGTSSRAVDVSTAVYQAEIWNPATETWKTMARMVTPRMYHSTSLLLPDGRVLVGGGGRLGFPEQFSAEIYSPPYLFKGPRPAITTAPSAIRYRGCLLGRDTKCTRDRQSVAAEAGRVDPCIQ